MVAGKICKTHGSFLVECMGGVDNNDSVSFGGAMNDRSNTTVHNGVPEQVYRTSFWRRFFRMLVFGKGDKIFIYQFPHILFYGLVGSLFMDFDHFFIRQLQMARPFHLPIWFGSIIFVGCYVTYIRGRVFHSSIRGSKSEKGE